MNPVRALRRPRTRVRAAWWLLAATVVLAAVDVGVFLAGHLSDRFMLFQTLILSWLALSLTALDIVATTDVRQAES